MQNTTLWLHFLNNLLLQPPTGRRLLGNHRPAVPLPQRATVSVYENAAENGAETTTIEQAKLAVRLLVK
jgi:hypothetical protein